MTVRPYIRQTAFPWKPGTNTGSDSGGKEFPDGGFGLAGAAPDSGILCGTAEFWEQFRQGAILTSRERLSEPLRILARLPERSGEYGDMRKRRLPGKRDKGLREVMVRRIGRYFAERKLGSQRALTEKYYGEVQAMYRQMRTWRHDYKNHLQVMKAHLDMGEYRELSDYIRRLDEELTSIGKFIETGNLALDAILNGKIAMAREKKIEVNVKVVLPPKLPVADYELCVLLGNLLDNAIEGCESQQEGEKRFLRIYVGLFREQLYVSVSNSHDTRMKKEGGRYRSTKSESRGFGILSIDSIVYRCHGYVNRKSDESIFVTEVMLPF